MGDGERRIASREPLPVGVYVVVDGVRHPGTLRDLSTSGAGFSDPVLAVRLNLEAHQKLFLEIPPENPGPDPLRLPGEVAHVSAGLRPRLGIQFDALDQATLERLHRRLGRKVAPASTARSRGSYDPDSRPSRGSYDPDSRRSRGSYDPDMRQPEEERPQFRYVLIEPAKNENKSYAVVTAVVIGIVVIAGFLGMLIALSKIEL